MGSGDLFGAGRDGAPATAGSYGVAPEGFRLPGATRLGPVRLQIADLERSLAFYRQVVGLHVVGDESQGALLGSAPPPPGEEEAAGRPVVELCERPGARPWPGRGRTGLFHFAILLPDRASLARFATHLHRLGVGFGAGDHLVSESLYLRDPDGLGIEVYADRPQADWRRVGRELRMATDPLDLAALREAAGGEAWSGVPAATIVGHLHLHVGDLVTADRYYSQALGFDRTVWSYPGALFLAAGGYHHHLGTNVWAGADATPPAADEAQLLDWTIELPDEASLAQVSESLAGGGFGGDRASGPDGVTEVRTQDPWGTPVVLRATGATS